ncbi:hypothetical protein B0H17DRAFT_1134250 [Mycena rosella]|uniref:Uncharacterized protein n=1 Tax=Mycena rosella TaxID=1033263 RepID=A0AAD7GE72_MYCRO|nr:hypothetical protein B0H17DRAFT_1134250 [Mycena rosella]
MLMLAAVVLLNNRLDGEEIRFDLQVNAVDLLDPRDEGCLQVVAQLRVGEVVRGAEEERVASPDSVGEELALPILREEQLADLTHELGEFHREQALLLLGEAQDVGDAVVVETPGDGGNNVLVGDLVSGAVPLDRGHELREKSGGGVASVEGGQFASRRVQGSSARHDVFARARHWGLGEVAVLCEFCGVVGFGENGCAVTVWCSAVATGAKELASAGCAVAQQREGSGRVEGFGGRLYRGKGGGKKKEGRILFKKWKHTKVEPREKPKSEEPGNNKTLRGGFESWRGISIQAYRVWMMEAKAEKESVM